MALGAIFIPNPAGIAALAENAAVTAGVMSKAEAVAETAQSIAPVRTGAYRDSIRVEESEGDVAVVADVDYAIYIEFGTSDTPAFAVLRRAGEGD